MTSGAFQYYQLERLDTAIEAELAAIDALKKKLEGDPRIATALARAGRIETRLTERQAALRKVDATVTDLSETIKRLNGRLYGGQIHDARELRSIEAEIEHAGHSRSEAEDREIELMEEVETLERDLASAREESEGLSSSRSADVELLRSELSGRDAKLAELKQERDSLAANVNAQAMNQYTRMRSRLGHAVSVVQGGVCQWCRVELPPKDVQHARGEAIVRCTNCSRILCVVE